MSVSHRPLLGLLVVGLGAGVVTLAPLGTTGDGLVRLESLDALLRTGHLDRSKYSMYGPIVAAPLWCAGELVGDAASAVLLFNRIVLLAAVAGLWATVGRLLSAPERVRFAALLLFGTMFPWHVIGFYTETFYTACVGLGLAVLALRTDRWAVPGAVLCVYGTANVPATAVGLALAAVVLALHRRRLRYLALPVGAAVLVLLENAVRRGHPLVAGYEGEFGYATALPYSGRPGFSYPLLFGLLSVLFSFGRGLVFFVPGLFAPLPTGAGEREGDLRLVYRVWLAVVVGLVLVYARWWAWYGGATWGPRFFLFASLPASLALARRTARAAEHSTGANAAALGAVALSVWVGANGLVFGNRGADPYFVNNYALEGLTWYVPECTALWLPVVEPGPLGVDDWCRLVTFAAALVYLAWPVGAVLLARARAALADARDRLRAGPRWRV